jgi:hypothetical protein
MLHNQESTTTFTVFKGILIGASGWFCNALSGRWAENNGGTVEVRDHDAQTFQSFLNYANMGRLFDSMPGLDVSFRSDRAEGSWPIKLSGSEDEARKMGEAPQETPLAARTRSGTKAVEEASRKRKRSSTTTEVQVEDVPKTANDIASLSH